jgi:hypothetical protein
MKKPLPATNETPEVLQRPRLVKKPKRRRRDRAPGPSGGRGPCRGLLLTGCLRSGSVAVVGPSWASLPQWRVVHREVPNVLRGADRAVGGKLYGWRRDTQELSSWRRLRSSCSRWRTVVRRLSVTAREYKSSCPRTSHSHAHIP